MRAVLAHAGRRLRGDYDVDEWGGDPDLVDLVDPLVRLVLRVEVDGGGRVPASGAGVLVANRRLGLAEPFAVVRAIRQATGRRARFLGIPDLAPLGPALRRFGGAVNRPLELAGLLWAGHLCILPLSSEVRRPPRAGNLRPASLQPALELGVPVVPVAVLGGELTGRWRVQVGPEVEHPPGSSPLDLAQLADSARNGVQALLDEASPPRRWLFD